MREDWKNFTYGFIVCAALSFLVIWLIVHTTRNNNYDEQLKLRHDYDSIITKINLDHKNAIDTTLLFVITKVKMREHEYFVYNTEYETQIPEDSIKFWINNSKRKVGAKYYLIKTN